MGKPKTVTAHLVPEEHESYETASELVESIHVDLEGAVILHFWRYWKPDADNIAPYAKAVIPNDVAKGLREHDLQVHLNAEVWDELDAAEKKYVLDHELKHFVRVMDPESGEPKQDDDGRQVYRVRRHDFEDFFDVLERHQDVAMALRRRQAVKPAAPLADAA